VRPGDTLYAIAFRYGLDFKTLAHWNEIPPPYTIFAEQRLRLSRPRNQRSVAQTTPSPQPAQGSQTQATQPASKPTAKPAAPVKSQPAPKPTPAQSSANDSRTSWLWPITGKVIKRFSAADESSRGIDIAAEEGQQVLAAAPGEVVYSGRGLIGYGELIIIKHNQNYLSAYGNNKTRLIQEGDRVSAGQVIATSGRSGSNRPVLHFEIRKNGKPVDPLRYLPR